MSGPRVVRNGPGMCALATQRKLVGLHPHHIVSMWSAVGAAAAASPCRQHRRVAERLSAVSRYSQLFAQYDVPGGRKVFALPFKSLLDVLQVSPVTLASAIQRHLLSWSAVNFRILVLVRSFRRRQCWRALCR